jgi:hypothetical protein
MRLIPFAGPMFCDFCLIEASSGCGKSSILYKAASKHLEHAPR